MVLGDGRRLTLAGIAPGMVGAILSVGTDTRQRGMKPRPCRVTLRPTAYQQMPS
jgi:hypothetical protein